MAVSIQAIGMVTALGLDWETSCAAERARIRRAANLGFNLQRLDTNDVEPANGHEVSLLTFGFEGFGRLLRLLVGALRSLKEHALVAGTPLDGAGLYLALPHSTRTRSGFDLITDPDLRARAQAEASYPATGDEDDDGRAPWNTPDQLVKKALQLSAFASGIELRRVVQAGHAGAVELIRGAMDDLSSGVCTRAIVAAVDSLVDEDVLEWLQLIGRLKNSGLATGVSPGEGGGVLCLGPAENERGVAVLEAVELHNESKPFDTGAPATGDALAQLILRLEAACKDKDQPLWIVSDQNGEVYRAAELGWALARIRKVVPRSQQAQIWAPAVSFGDTGAASAILGIATAAAGWKRCYSPSAKCLILSSSDGAERGGVLLSKPGKVGEN